MLVHNSEMSRMNGDSDLHNCIIVGTALPALRKGLAICRPERTVPHLCTFLATIEWYSKVYSMHDRDRMKADTSQNSLVHCNGLDDRTERRTAEP